MARQDKPPGADTARPSVPYCGFEIELVPRECFDFLYDGLREAKRRFQTGEDAGRDSVRYALQTVLWFLLQLEPARKEGMLFPFTHLLNALGALDTNNVLPLLKPLKPRPRSGAPPASDS